MAASIRNLGLVVSIIVFFIAGTDQAQRTTGSLGGVVQDESEALIPGADVTVTSQRTGIVRTAVTSDVGTFFVPSLPPGSYSLRITMPGFKSFEQTDIPVESARDVRGTFVLQLGEVTEIVTVEGAASLINTVGAEQRLGLDSIQVESLPNPNRNITNLLVLNPAVTVTGGHRAARLNGMGRHASSYTMDGIEASGSTEGNLISQYSGTNKIDLISTEGIQEVQIIKGVVPAEYGNTVSGQVNIITKSGTSEIHGSLFHLYQTHALNGQDPFLSSKPKLVYNQFGGSVGFPILKKGIGFVSQAFGFVAYEGYEERRVRRVQEDVPTQLARDEILASPNFDSREQQILKLILDPLPFPNQELDSPIGGQFRSARPQPGEDDTILVKSDVHFVDGSFLSFTWNRLDPSFIRPGIVPLDDRTWFDNANRYAASWFKGTGSWSLESRFGLSLIDQVRLDVMFEELRDPVFEEVIPFTRRVPTFDTPDFESIGGEVWNTDSTTYTLDQKIGHIRGNHSIKFGGGYQYKAGNRTNPEMPSFDFKNYQDFLANRPNRVTYTFGEPNHNGRIFLFGFFFQDDWKVHQNITLNMGLRYDFISNFVASRRDSGENQTGRGVDLTNLNLEPPTNWEIFDFGRPLPASKPFDHDPVNFAPRFGFNWDLTGEGETVLRGGFGVMFAPNTIATLRDVVQDLFVPRRVRFSGDEISQFGLRLGTLNAEGRDIVRTRSLAGGFNPLPFSLYNPFLESPYSMNYTLGIQHEMMQDTVIEIDYVGQRGVKFPLNRDVNEPDRLTGQRPNPRLAGVSFYIDQSQNSVYNAIQVALKKRFTRGLSYGMTYAYGRALATSGSDTGARFGSDNIENCCQEFFNPLLARGRVPGDIEHNFTANWFYQLPFMQGQSATIRNLLGGWTFAGIVRAQTGTPRGVSQRGGRGVNRPDVLDIGNARFEDFDQTLQFWNAAAFEVIPLSPAGMPIRAGNANRALLSGPGFWTIDASFGKEFVMRENMRLRFQWDWINAFNHVNLGGPRSNLTSSRFGRIEGLGGGMRVTQLNLKLLF
ncbi:MAG: TonB-dependent receptor [Acidobacteriota bacterium]